MRIKVHVSGLEKLPKGTRFLLVQNHRSKFDPILTWYVLRKYDLAFLSKEENMHIPIFGRIIRKCCFMSIDRKHPRRAMETVNTAVELLKD
ncbi:MAG: 1-acyl-sn-glycerol-3-phosphate acyltransferase, partial [Lachnospiraceae bacterium]|nr:1-acyl-sn-glycerol-3-phosphate acyltransferase [Lachnospiraceae bacterium]